MRWDDLVSKTLTTASCVVYKTKNQTRQETFCVSTCLELNGMKLILYRCSRLLLRRLASFIYLWLQRHGFCLNTKRTRAKGLGRTYITLYRLGLGWTHSVVSQGPDVNLKVEVWMLNRIIPWTFGFDCLQTAPCQRDTCTRFGDAVAGCPKHSETSTVPAASGLAATSASYSQIHG